MDPEWNCKLDCSVSATECFCDCQNGDAANGAGGSESLPLIKAQSSRSYSTLDVFLCLSCLLPSFTICSDTTIATFYRHIVLGRSG